MALCYNKGEEGDKKPRKCCHICCLPSKVGEELSPTDVGEEEVEEGGVLAAPGEGDQKGMLDLLQEEEVGKTLGGLGR